MNTQDEKDALLAPLRELPVEVDLHEVEHMVAAFPAAMGTMAWLLHTAKFNLNTIIMTSIGTLLLGTGIVVLSLHPQQQPPNPAPVRPSVVATPQAVPEPVKARIVPPSAMPTGERPTPLAVQPSNRATEPERSIPQDPAPEPVAAAPTVVAVPRPATPAPYAGTKTQANERVFDLSGFTGILLNSSLDVMVEQGPFSVTASGPQDLLDKLELKTEENLLVVGFQFGKWTMAKDRQPTVMVRLPRLEQLIVQGSGDIALAPLTDAARLELMVMGSGSIAMAGAANMANLGITVAGSGDVACDQLDVKQEVVITVTGSGDVHVAGRTDQLEVNLVGSGDVHASDLKANTGHVNLAGSGDVFVADVATMQLSKVGSGDLHVGGSTDAENTEDDGHND